MKILGFLTATIFIALFQVGFLSSLAYPWNALNVIVCVSIFVGIFFDYRSGMLLAFVSGFLFDLYQSFLFGGYTLILLFTLSALHLVFENFFTNRSLYTLTVLGIAGTVIFNAVFFLTHFSVFYETIGWDFFEFLGYQIFLNAVFLAVSFFIVNTTSRKFQSAFLSRT